MAKINLISPWDEYYNKMVAFFEEDFEVTVLYDDKDDNAKYINVLVDNPEKARALEILLEHEKQFGNITLYINVITANEIPQEVVRRLGMWKDEENYYYLYQPALYGNMNLSGIREVKGLMGFDAIYVVFKKKVIQYHNDNIGDFYGMKSTLAEYIARDIFVPHDGVFFNTTDEDINQNDENYARNYYGLTGCVPKV